MGCINRLLRKNPQSTFRRLYYKMEGKVDMQHTGAE